MALTIHSIPIVVDDMVLRVEEARDHPPSDWLSRCMYVTKQGAENWLALARESGYPLSGSDPYDLRKNRLAAIKLANVRTMLSLGPGDGIHDIELVRTLQEEERIKYIPLEISRHLLARTIENLKEHVDIPVGVLCDFEEDRELMDDALRRYADRPILLALLGGTVGNLDRGEPRFFAALKAIMERGDFLLLDVPLAGPAWQPGDDPRLAPSSYPRTFRQLLVGGLSAGACQQKADMPADESDRRIGASLEESGAIEQTKRIVIYDTRTMRTITEIRRYHWESIIRWLQDEGFEIVFRGSSIKSDEEKFGMGVLLLKR